MAVSSRLIVERFDVVRNVCGSNFSVLVDSLFDALFLQTAEEGFCDRIDAPMSSLDSKRHPLNRPGSAGTAREQCSASGIVEFPWSTDPRRFGGQHRRGCVSRFSFLPLKSSIARCWRH